MSDKFKYAPGKPGFGSKGNNGTDGQPGLSMYFTDFDPITQSILINSKIENNQTLWSANPPESLPSGRIYVTGDLFFDSDGKAYEINAETNTFIYKFANLNMGGFFIPLGISSSEGYQRYFNSNIGQKYIIDQVYTQTSDIDYTQTPSFIYNIVPANFTRIEYTNVKPAGTYNAFTTYTIGGEDNQALALVYDEDTATFRLGNVDTVDNIRNTNLTFDVSLLSVTKQSGINTFTLNTPEGAILTNYEIAANSLFDPNFTAQPTSFIGVKGTVNDCSIAWNLADFTDDTDITADLYFYEKIFSYDTLTYRLDASIVRPLVFSDIDVSGSIKFNGLKTNTPYAFYIKINKNGWIRNSNIQTITSSLLTVAPSSHLEPSLATLPNASIGFDVNSTLTWNYTVLLNPDTFMYGITSPSTGGLDGSIYVGLTANLGTDRLGTIRVTPQAGSSVDISIYQTGNIVTVPVTFFAGSDSNADGGNWKWYQTDDSINVSTLPASTTVDVSIRISTTHQNYASDTALYWSGVVTLKSIANATLASKTWTLENVSPSTTDTSTVYFHITNIPKTSFPLNIEVYNYGLYNSAHNGPGIGTIVANNINLYYNSGPVVVFNQTSTTSTAPWTIYP